MDFGEGFCHIITRGNQRQEIFLDGKDFLKYLEVLTDDQDRYGFLIHAYVLMSNTSLC
jgi:putative transposase